MTYWTNKEFPGLYEGVRVPLDALCESCCKPFAQHGTRHNECPKHAPYPYAGAEKITATEIHEHATQTAGVKYDSDKPRMDLLDPHAIEQLAKVLGFGAQKYAAHNWRKGISKGRLLAAALRHLFAYLGGQDTDPETGLSHAAHAMCCCMFLLGLEGRADLDDRFKAAQQSPHPLPGSKSPSAS